MRRHWRLALLALAGGVLVIALLAPTMLGRMLGGLWVSVMSSIVALIDGLIR